MFDDGSVGVGEASQLIHQSLEGGLHAVGDGDTWVGERELTAFTA